MPILLGVFVGFCGFAGTRHSRNCPESRISAGLAARVTTRFARQWHGLLSGH